MSTIHRLYNLLHTGNPGDVAYYVKHCQAGMTVLELGCGNGRVAAALMDAGCHVVGLDNDAQMRDGFLNAMSRFASPVPVHLSDMRSFDLGEKFHRIIIPFNGLLCMLSLDDVAKVFARAAAHLLDDGELIFDVYHVPDDFENDGIEDEAYVDTAVIDDDGKRVEVYEKTLSTGDPQRFDTSYIFVMNAGTAKEQQLEHTIAQRCLYVHQIRDLLHHAGFVVTAIRADFAESDEAGGLTEDTRQIAVHARLNR
ncbi:MAG: class I SAM-dependent methyltransferase [Deltaproteobacteria bacterium]|nr:class I SAM-dependent methyltransferase [Deltaproteobacteria bacterium]